MYKSNEITITTTENLILQNIKSDFNDVLTCHGFYQHSTLHKLWLYDGPGAATCLLKLDFY